MVRWFESLSIGFKVSDVLAAVYFAMSLIHIFWFTRRQEEQEMNKARTFASGFAFNVLSTLNTMMVRGHIVSAATS